MTALDRETGPDVSDTNETQDRQEQSKRRWLDFARQAIAQRPHPPCSNCLRPAAISCPIGNDIGTQRDIRAANRALGKAIMALLRIEKRLEGEDSDRFGHTLDAACMASNSLLIFADGGWGTDAGVVRLYASETDDGS